MDDVPISFDVIPIIENNRVLVPFRAIFEAFDAQVLWEGSTSTVTADKDTTSIILQIGNEQMQLNGETITLDVPPRLVNSRTFVPVRAVSEGLNATVDWDEENRLVRITKNQ